MILAQLDCAVTMHRQTAGWRLNGMTCKSTAKHDSKHLKNNLKRRYKFILAQLDCADPMHVGIDTTKTDDKYLKKTCNVVLS